MTSATPVKDITAVILAGGQARRMGGTDKGLINLHGRAMVDYIIAGQPAHTQPTQTTPALNNAG